MSSRRLPRHLRVALGTEAGEELVTILDDIRADRKRSQSEHREQMARIDQRFDRLESRMVTLEVKLGDVKADLMKWSFVFWCGAVASVAALAGVLR